MDSEYESLLLDLEELQKEISKKKYDLIFDITGLEPQECVIGDWKCSDSPIGKCVYDRYEDSACDCCVFCGQPDDRR